MTVDGRAIARDILQEVRNRVSHRTTAPHLTVLTCAPNFETRTFLAIKKRRANDVGIGVSVVEFPGTVTTEEVVQSVAHAAMQSDGIVVQLPFPPHIDRDKVLAAVPHGCDVDALTYDGTDDRVLPPVVGAIDAIAKRHGVPFAGANVVIVGSGMLVGTPACLYASRMGASVTMIDRDTPARDEAIKSADILILGAGSPHVVTPDMVRDGVVIFDAGTSEAAGVLAGDADPACAAKASLMTPVPGGIGPITVAVLLRNVVLLSEQHARN